MCLKIINHLLHNLPTTAKPYMPILEEEGTQVLTNALK